MSNLLVGINSLGETVQNFSVTADGGETVMLDVMVAGEVPPNPSELLGSERMHKLLTTLREHYDYIILDLPPVTAVTDALIACKLVDGMVIVVRNNHAVRGALAETIRQLKLVDARVLGFVFNGATESGTSYYKGKKGYRKHYYYQE